MRVAADSPRGWCRWTSLGSTNGRWRRRRMLRTRHGHPWGHRPRSFEVGLFFLHDHGPTRCLRGRFTSEVKATSDDRAAERIAACPGCQAFPAMLVNLLAQPAPGRIASSIGCYLHWGGGRKSALITIKVV